MLVFMTRSSLRSGRQALKQNGIRKQSDNFNLKCQFFCLIAILSFRGEKLKKSHSNLLTFLSLRVAIIVDERIHYSFDVSFLGYFPAVSGELHGILKNFDDFSLLTRKNLTKKNVVINFICSTLQSLMINSLISLEKDEICISTNNHSSHAPKSKFSGVLAKH